MHCGSVLFWKNIRTKETILVPKLRFSCPSCSQQEQTVFIQRIRRCRAQAAGSSQDKRRSTGGHLWSVSVAGRHRGSREQTVGGPLHQDGSGASCCSGRWTTQLPDAARAVQGEPGRKGDGVQGIAAAHHPSQEASALVPGPAKRHRSEISELLGMRSNIIKENGRTWKSNGRKARRRR